MAKCVVCKREQMGYEWTQTKNGKKWLFNKQLGQWHDCPKSNSKFSRKEDFTPRLRLEKIDYNLCELCGTHIITDAMLLKHPQLNFSGASMKDHLQTMHPNGEILDEIDLKVCSDEEKAKMRLLWGQPKRTTKYS